MEDKNPQENINAVQDAATEVPHQPTPEEIERTKKVMHDSLAARKPKGFLESLKEWFR